MNIYDLVYFYYDCLVYIYILVNSFQGCPLYTFIIDYSDLLVYSYFKQYSGE